MITNFVMSHYKKTHCDLRDRSANLVNLDVAQQCQGLYYVSVSDYQRLGLGLDLGWEGFDLGIISDWKLNVSVSRLSYSFTSLPLIHLRPRRHRIFIRISQGIAATDLRRCSRQYNSFFCNLSPTATAKE